MLNLIRKWIVRPAVVLAAIPLAPIFIVLGLIYSAGLLNLYCLYYLVDPVKAKIWWNRK